LARGDCSTQPSQFHVGGIDWGTGYLESLSFFSFDPFLRLSFLLWTIFFIVIIIIIIVVIVALLDGKIHISPLERVGVTPLQHMIL